MISSRLTFGCVRVNMYVCVWIDMCKLCLYIASFHYSPICSLSQSLSLFTNGEIVKRFTTVYCDKCVCVYMLMFCVLSKMRILLLNHMFICIHMQAFPHIMHLHMLLPACSLVCVGVCVSSISIGVLKYGRNWCEL